MRKFGYAFEQPLARRALLKMMGISPLLSVVASCDSSLDEQDKALSNIPAPGFNPTEEKILRVVQLILFPDDGNGPSAEDIFAFKYLQWALQDPANQADGDFDFIQKGIGWLDDLARSRHQAGMMQLTSSQQSDLITTIANSSAGENWLSLLLYYISEALCLDPIYGGNREEIGWRWLEHQAGFPRPQLGTRYFEFDYPKGAL